jgi:hypothetical protein
MSVLDGFVDKSIWPRDASTGPRAKLMGSTVCEGRGPPRTAMMVLNELIVESSERFFSTSRTTMIG